MESMVNTLLICLAISNIIIVLLFYIYLKTKKTNVSDKEKIVKYLSHPSCDGSDLRRKLRKKLIEDLKKEGYKIG